MALRRHLPSLLLITVVGAFLPEGFARGFRTVESYPTTGGVPTAATVQDFNHDQLSDIVTANKYDANVSVLLGRANGSFGQPLTFSVGPGAVEVASADLNGDGNADLAVTDGIKSVRIVPGNGDGTFGEAVRIDLQTNPIGLQIADLNRDGALDLAVAIYGSDDDSSGAAAILLGNGDGTFAPPVSYPLTHHGVRLVVTELNGDGNLDLAVAVEHSPEEQDGLAILLGNGDGTFQTATTSVAGNAAGVAAGDFNGDGKMDLALAAHTSEVVRVLLGNGDGTFLPPLNYATQGTAETVVAVDLDRDGALDLVVGGGHTAVLSGHGDGTFAEAVVYAIGDHFAVVGNFNRDRVPDIVAETGYESIAVALGKGDGSFRAGLAYVVENGVDEFGAADFNEDGVVDLAVGADGFVILFGDGRGGLIAGEHFGNITPEFVRPGDFNGDGKADILFADQLNKIHTYLGNGDGTFGALQSISVPGEKVEPAVGDFNNDGRLDVVATVFFRDSARILLGQGDGTFVSAGDYRTGDAPQSPVAGDFNGDGNLDFVVCNAYDDTIGLYLGHGDGTFQSPLELSIRTPVYSAAADLNRDGKVDLVVGGDARLVLFLGNGDGTFQAPRLLTNDYGPIQIGDVDGDGELDIAISLGYAGLAVLRGHGDGTFIRPVEFATGSQHTGSFVLADLNNDGLPEAIAENLSDSLSVLLNTTPTRSVSPLRLP